MPILVKSHISRDLLQSAGMFKNERLVVWEYVSNSLQYVNKGVSPKIRVSLNSKNKSISILDNGRGMNWADLENYFIMHGENQDRKTGQPGRGYFGTGKSAAFGIADSLKITTTKNGKTSAVQLLRKDLENCSSGSPVPVTTIYKEKPTDLNDGTLVEIEKIHLKLIDQSSVIEYIERHLVKWPKDVSVIVNNHLCEFIEPSIEREEVFETFNKKMSRVGKTKLIIRVSRSPLEKDFRGISIFSNGVWLETSMLGFEGKEMANFIFGEIDVETLADDNSVPSAFDASRSMKLNPQNEIVNEVYQFIGPLFEKVRKELVEEYKNEKASEEANRLRDEASKIENIINSDFDSFRMKLKKIQTTELKHGPDTGNIEFGEKTKGTNDFLFGGNNPATIENDIGEVGFLNLKEVQNSMNKDEEPPELNPIVKPKVMGDSKGHYVGDDGKKKRSGGGFSIEFSHLGSNMPDRAEYKSEFRTIYINLDHPQIIAAKKDRSPEDPVFRRLAYEVAFTEYAIALAFELNKYDPYVDVSDPIFDIRQSINRIALKSAEMYS